ncbi:MAG: insulinase family protein [Flavobacteriales bacterium]|nr:insulinase family protein [Flavobacteriales bacterium]
MFRSIQNPIPGALLVLAALALPHAMNAQAERSKAPNPGPAPKVRVGDHKSFTLANGMRVIVVENHKVPLVSVQVRFDVPLFRQAEKAGMTDLAGELLASGTRRKTKAQIDEAVDKLGASLSTASDGLYAQTLSRNLPALMDLVYEIVTSATFPPDEFEKAKKRMLSAIKSREDSPDAIADVVANALTFGKGHPYGEVETERTLNMINRAHVFTYYQRFFRPQDGYLVFVGDITEAQAKTIAERLFNDWTAAEVKSTVGADGVETVDGLGAIRLAGEGPAASGVRRVAFVDRPGAPQSVVRVIFPVRLKPGDMRATSAQVLNTILGGGVFNARLMQNLREDKGYTYGCYSNLESDRYAGRFSAGASVRTEVTDSAVAEILNELELIRDERVTLGELTLAKSYLAGSFARSLEDPRTVARFALSTYLNNLKKDHYSTYLQRLDTVSAASVYSAAQDFLFPDNAVILVVGDKDRVANKLVQFSAQGGVAFFDANGEPFREAFEKAPEGLTSEAVLEAYFKACGGRKAIEGIRDLRIEMSASIMGQQIDMTQLFAQPHKYSMEMRSGPITVQKVAYDGQRGFSQGAEGKRELEAEELEDMAQNAYPFPEMHYQSKYHHKVFLNGIVDVDGTKAYKLTISTENGNVAYEYYDVTTGLKLRRVEPKYTPEGNMTITTKYADYKPVGGVLFPHMVTQHMGMDLEFVVKEIAVNKGLPATAFDLGL